MENHSDKALSPQIKLTILVALCATRSSSALRSADASSSFKDETTGPPPAPTTGPPSDHRRTTVGAPLAPIGTSDHCRTTAGPLSDHHHHRTTIGPPRGPPSVHHLHPSAHRTTAGPSPPSDHRRTTVGAPPAPIGTSDHCRTTAGPLSDYRRCDGDADADDRNDDVDECSITYD
ncbi:hypothetical protein LXL04_020150 [Taraxacum kok-saghyz]